MAASKKRGLGKGLDALIPPAKKQRETTNKSEDSGRMLIDISKVEPNRDQPRKNFDEDALEELADSIKQVGVLEPLLVRTKGNLYDIIAGERRWRAARKAGLKEVPVIIRDDLTEQQVVEIQLIENIQRENLNPIEEAQAYERLIHEFHMKQDEVAERVSKSRAAVTNSMRLLKLSAQVQQMVIDEMLSTGHARALISVEDTTKQYELAQRIFDEHLSVREAEKIVRRLNAPTKQKNNKKPDINLEQILHDLEDKCKNATGTKVTIIPKSSGKGGKIEVEYYSSDDLEKITDLLLGKS